MSSIIFDLDGTLADSRECLLASLNYAFETIGLNAVPYCPVQSLQQDLMSTYRQTLKDLQLEVDEHQMKKFIEAFRWYHEHEGESSIVAYEGIADTLENLKKTHVLAVATTKHSPQARRVLRKIGLISFFDHIQGTDPGLNYKPAPDILWRTLKVLEIPTRKAAYVGDGHHDMTAARHAGLVAVGAAYGFGGDQPLLNSGFDFLIRHHQELLDLRAQLNDFRSLDAGIRSIVGQ